MLKKTEKQNKTNNNNEGKTNKQTNKTTTKNCIVEGPEFFFAQPNPLKLVSVVVDNFLSPNNLSSQVLVCGNNFSAIVKKN